MNFNTLEFLFIFLPITLLVFHRVPASFRLPVLALSSAIFYGMSGLLPVTLMVGVIIWVFLLTRVLKSRNTSFIKIFIGVSIPFLVLFLFKYLNFSFDVFKVGDAYRQLLGPVLAVTLPAGISFYTFQISAYAIDALRGRIDVEKDPIRFFAFVSFFPQLIAGPILRYHEILPQLKRIQKESKLSPDFRLGLKFLVVGLFWKTFFSDIFFIFHDQFELGRDQLFTDSLYSIFSYSFIIYYDFWSYSLMAMGLGKMFSINLPRNFIEPYKSKNPKEFWRRWHVTLSVWLKDYVYIALGGNRSYVRNICIVFLACGLWHGAGLSFLAWGLYHAILVVFYHLTKKLWDRLPGKAQVGLTFVLVSLGWPLFYLDLSSYLSQLYALTAFNFGADSVYGMKEWFFMFVIGAWVFLVSEDKLLFVKSKRTLFRLVAWLPFQLFLLWASVMYLSFGRTFIYFRF